MQDLEIDKHVEDFKERQGFLNEIKNQLEHGNNTVCIKLQTGNKFELVLNIDNEEENVSLFNSFDGFYTMPLKKLHKSTLEDILFYLK
jgi:hypothetical protein